MYISLKDFISFIKFAIVGVINTLLNWLIFFNLNRLGLYYISSNIIAYIMATMNSYLWNSILVFKYKVSFINNRSIKFILLNLSGLIINTILLFILVDIFYFKKLTALILVTPIVMILNFAVNKLWIFKK